MSVTARIVLLKRGGPRIRPAQGHEVTLSGQSGAVLAILALKAGQDVSREWIAGLLWPDRDPSSASRGLTGEIRSVREAALSTELGAVVADQGLLRLDVPSDAVDAREFEALAGSGDADARGSALAIYAADLLEGFAAPSNECEHWFAQERARLRNLAISVASGLMSEQLEAGDRTAALASAQRLLSFDPGHEAAHRAAMRLLAESGRRAEAVRQFEICRETLARDYDLEPEAETLALLDAIQQPSDLEEARAIAAPLTPPAARADGYRVGALRWTALSAGALALIVAIYFVVVETWLTRAPIQPADASRIARPVPTVPSVIVASFAYDAEDPELGALAEYLADALADNLLIASGLVVIDAREITRLQSEPLSPAKAAETYGVKYFIHGRLRQSGDNVKLSVGLIDAFEGVHKWEKTYRFTELEAAGLRERLALEILVELEVELQEGEQARIALMHGTSNLEAWAAAAEGLRRLRLFSPEENRAARELYERARRLDPEYPGAIGGLGWTYFVEAYFGWTDDREKSLQEAGRLAAAALAIDPDRPRTLSLLGVVTVFQDPEQGLAFAERAVALSPSSAEEKAILGLLETYVGSADRAVELFLQAKRLSVRAPDWFEWGLGRALRRAGRYDDAIAVLRASIEKSHRANSPRVELVLSLWQAGEIDAARREARALLAAHPGFSVRDWAVGAPQPVQSGVIEEAALLIQAGLPE